MAKATFGAGCFWGIEAAFRQVPGVVDAAVGYMGGTLENPTYQDVCTDTTGHAEVVQVTFDPAQVSYQQLLDLFWEIHDPTTPNRQGPDVGKQYRSAIFFHSTEQEAAARASKEKQHASVHFPGPDCHRDHPSPNLLPSRGIPPAIFRKAGHRRLPSLAILQNQIRRTMGSVSRQLAK